MAMFLSTETSLRQLVVKCLLAYRTSGKFREIRSVRIYSEPLRSGPRDGKVVQSKPKISVQRSRTLIVSYYVPIAAVPKVPLEGFAANAALN